MWTKKGAAPPKSCEMKPSNEELDEKNQSFQEKNKAPVVSFKFFEIAESNVKMKFEKNYPVL